MYNQIAQTVRNFLSRYAERRKKKRILNEAELYTKELCTITIITCLRSLAMQNPRFSRPVLEYANDLQKEAFRRSVTKEFRMRLLRQMCVCVCVRVYSFDSLKANVNRRFYRVFLRNENSRKSLSSLVFAHDSLGEFSSYLCVAQTSTLATRMYNPG